MPSKPDRQRKLTPSLSSDDPPAPAVQEEVAAPPAPAVQEEVATPPAPDAWRESLETVAPGAPAVDESQLAAVLETTQPGALGAAPPPGAAPASSQRAPHLWSRRKISKAPARELRKYVEELQARVPPPGEPSGEAAPAAPVLGPSERLQLLENALGPTFGMVATMAGRMMKTTAVDLAPAESSRLARAWAPLLLPHYDELVAGLPWALALGETYEVLWPKLEVALQERESRRKVDGAESIAAVAVDAAE